MTSITADEVIGKIREAGLVGQGGAGFPTHVKAKARVETLIANGAECEPLLACDEALMVRRPGEILEGLRILGRAVSAGELVVAVKEKNREARAALEEALSGATDIRIRLLGDFYPAGDEVTLVHEVTGRVVPEGDIPPAVGVMVQNVGTLAAIPGACQGRPFTRRYVTVAGEVESPHTVEAPLGTSLRTLVKAAGGARVRPFAVITGGPCMGALARSLDDPVTKTTTGILVLPPDHPLVAVKSANPDQLLHRAKSVCDQCRDCTDLCPRFLLGHRLDPQRLMTAVAWGNRLSEAELEVAHLCCECGLCGLYACPTGLYPNLYIRKIKDELNRAGHPKRRGLSPETPRPEYGDRKVPSPRLKARLGLSAYPNRVPLADEPLRPKKVRILLKQHVGVPARPVVEVGTHVVEGDLVGEIPDGALGARIHASIDGEVVEATPEQVILKAVEPA